MLFSGRLPVVGAARGGSLSRPPRTPGLRVHCMANYRWSAEREGGGRRKRESLYDNAEPDDAAAPPANGRRRARAATVQPPPAAQQPAEQPQQAEPGEQPAWDAVAWGSGPQEPSSSNGNGSRGAAAAAADPGVWDEWGPDLQDPSQLEDFGWAAESWAGGSTRRPSASSSQWQPEAGGREPPPPPEQQQQQQPGRAAHQHTYGGSRWGAQQQGGPGGGSEGKGPSAGYYAAGGQQQQQPGPGPGYEGHYSANYEPGLVPPDIALLSQTELDRTLPIVPFPDQASYFSGGAVETVQRWGAGLAATVVLSKVAVLAMASLTWPFWWPWALAGKKNYAMRQQLRYAGLWRTQVLDVEITGRPKPVFGEAPEGSGGGVLGGRFSTMRLAKFLVGDPGGARTEMTLPYDSRYELVREGEPAELLVLSDSPEFESFRAVKDVYLPANGFWLSEYPYTDRTSFLEVSLEIECEAQQEEEVAQQAQQMPRSDYYSSNY